MCPWLWGSIVCWLLTILLKVLLIQRLLKMPLYWFERLPHPANISLLQCLACNNCSLEPPCSEPREELLASVLPYYAQPYLDPLPYSLLWSRVAPRAADLLQKHSAAFWCIILAHLDWLLSQYRVGQAHIAWSKALFCKEYFAGAYANYSDCRFMLCLVGYL